MRKLESDREGETYQERSYRSLLQNQDLISFQVKVKETDLFIRATRDLGKVARESILRYRYQLEKYIVNYSEFFRSLVPLPADEWAPSIAQKMIQAAQCAGVGPMAAVAGAIAEAVGQDLLKESAEVIVENGGDIFIHSPKEVKVGIFAGRSPLSFRIGLRVPGADHDWGVCTSSATVGPSLSLGGADAVCILSPSAPLADAAATAVGNVVSSSADLSSGLEKAKTIAGIIGAVIIAGDKMGVWGDVQLIEI